METVFSYLFACSLELVLLSRNNLIKVLLLITSNQYWYFTAYIIILILSPIINLAFDKLSHKQIMFTIIGLLYFFSIMATLGYTASLSENRIGTIILLYCIGAYIRKYHSHKSKNCLFIELLLAFLFLTLLSSTSILYDKYTFFQKIALDRFFLVWGVEKTPIIIFSTLVFLIFKNLSIKPNKFINWIAASAFGVYLLHMNTWTTNYIWNNLCRTKDYYQSPNMIVHVLICCFMIYIICTAIDKLRIYLLERPIEFALNNLQTIKARVILCITGVCIIIVCLYTNELKILTPCNNYITYDENTDQILL